MEVTKRKLIVLSLFQSWFELFEIRLSENGRQMDGTHIQVQFLFLSIRLHNREGKANQHVLHYLYLVRGNKECEIMTLSLRSKTYFKNICYLISGQTFLLHMVTGFTVLLISKELFIFTHHTCVKYPNGKYYCNYSICSLSP